MVWDHRGLQLDSTESENSLLSYDHAIAEGAKGIEMDIFYDDSLADFVISHDRPYQLQADSSVMMLSQVMAQYGQSIYYWLDLKNLSLQNRNAVAQRMQHLLDSLSLAEQVYIESGESRAAYLLTRHSSLNLILWIQYNSKKSIVASLKKLYYKMLIGMGDFSAVSRGYRYADEDFRAAFGDFPCYIFHIYSRAELDSTAAWVPGSSVLLVDSPFYTLLD